MQDRTIYVLTVVAAMSVGALIGFSIHPDRELSREGMEESSVAAIDENGDGKPDVWWYSTNGFDVEMQQDRNCDGVPDVRYVYEWFEDPSGKAASRVHYSLFDDRFDGTVTAFHNFVNGQPDVVIMFPNSPDRGHAISWHSNGIPVATVIVSEGNAIRHADVLSPSTGGERWRDGDGDGLLEQVQRFDTLGREIGDWQRVDPVSPRDLVAKSVPDLTVGSVKWPEGSQLPTGVVSRMKLFQPGDLMPPR